jgi:asparagine synthase (glutamine-hydrolysing)
VPEGLKLLSHRGPDKSGALRIALGWSQIQLGMTRLTITDRKNHVPVPGAWDGIYVAYNGEIYNHREVARDLGLQLETENDMEVLAKGWRKLGPQLLPKLNGMFAFVLVDAQNDEVWLVRDRAGEKPLFHASYDGRLYVASELKALPVPLWEQVLSDLDTFEYDCLEETPFEHVKRLSPGCYIKLEKFEDLIEDCVPIRRWWHLPRDMDTRFTNVGEAAEELEPLLRNAIEIRWPGEVNAAVQLSGGLDSAIIQAVVESDRLYTVSFPADGVDNMKLALRAAKGRRVPEEVSFGAVQAKAALPQIAWHLGTPATWTAVAQWFLMKAIADGGNKVCLSGEGADELFLGYSRYRILWHMWLAEKDPKLVEYGPTLRYLVGSAMDIMSKLLDRGETLASEARARDIVNLYRPEGRSLPRQMAHVEFHTTMQVLLRMADRMASAWSLENRSPFLDYRVMEFGARLPVGLCIGELGNKAILREVATRLGVVAEIVHETTKRGLFIPWPKWFPAKGAGEGRRGPWDRAAFRDAMLEAWRDGYDSRRDRPTVCMEACLKLR